MIIEFGLVGVSATAIALALLWKRSRQRTSELTVEIEALRSKYAPIISVETAVEELEQSAAGRRQEIEQLRSDYREKKDIYDRLCIDMAVIDERLSFAEMGVYEPHFDFTDPEEFKDRIRACRETQKLFVERKIAVQCATEWTVDGSKAKGATMTNRNIRLTLRALNNECDAAISNARWNNVLAMEKRIVKAAEQIDKMNASNHVVVNPDYLKLKIEELRLTHEHRERVKVEREERAEAMRLAREEQRLLRDLEKAQEDEDHYQRLLAKAQAEAASIEGPKLEAFAQQIAILEQDLAEAQRKRERAQAMAEQTRSGYVYIISNIGSFGDGVIKIGLTRRLDPLDRIRELGDASVPFVFDIHAMIYSDDAPSLERALHAEFEETRINSQNLRKEFFRASIDQVELAVRRIAPAAAFFRDVEAQEYMETLSRRNAMLAAAQVTEPAYPAEL